MIEIKRCRICGKEEFEEVLNLGLQTLTGVFPTTNKNQTISSGPLRLTRCTSPEGCGLVQLANSYSPDEMYGENYGYRSGLNPSMVQHLRHRINDVTERLALVGKEVVIDIGSNDGTSLGFYQSTHTRIGIDPTASKFRKYYPSEVLVVSDFFNSELALEASNSQKASVITAFSMMYDLEDPITFVQDVQNILHKDGLFVFEQSYLPLMIAETAFDTICHEHLEYYGLRQIDYILDKAGLEAIDVEFNDTNGGSFAITAGHIGRYTVSNALTEARVKEQDFWLNAKSIFADFKANTYQAIENLQTFVKTERDAGKRFGGLGASTKGNVILQASKLGPEHIEVIGDVNPDKQGRYTPGSLIPIISETEALEKNLDYYIVFPWHFRNFFSTSLAFQDVTLVFPLPILDFNLPHD